MGNLAKFKGLQRLVSRNQGALIRSTEDRKIQLELVADFAMMKGNLEV